MSASTRSRVVSMSQNGLAKEGITVSKRSLCLLIIGIGIGGPRGPWPPQPFVLSM